MSGKADISIIAVYPEDDGSLMNHMEGGSFFVSNTLKFERDKRAAMLYQR